MLPWFTKYPNQNDEILNLDWVIRQVENLKAAYEAFLAANSLTFADPIVWDITKQYSKNTIVLSSEGDAYLSKKVVGAGVQLNNTDYWLEIFNFAEYVRTANSNLTMHIEQNTTRATASYAVNDWVLWEDVLYKVTTAISVDDLLTVGTNIVHFTVEDFCRTWQTYMINTIAAYKADIDASEAEYKRLTDADILQYKNDVDASEALYRNQLASDISNTTASLQAQLNEAIAGVTVDSEVINARIGFNNYTFSTLGDALRTQVNFLKDSILSLSSIDSLPPKMTWVQGNLNGGVYDSTDLTRICTSDYLNYNVQTIDVPSGYSIGFVIYDYSDTYVTAMAFYTGTVNVKSLLASYDGYKIKIVMRHIAVIDPTEGDLLKFNIPLVNLITDNTVKLYTKVTDLEEKNGETVSFEYGSLDISGNEIASTSRIRTIGYLPLNTLYVKLASSDFSFIAMVYDYDGNFVGSDFNYVQTLNMADIYSTYGKYTKVRLIVREYQDNIFPTQGIFVQVITSNDIMKDRAFWSNRKLLHIGTSITDETVYKVSNSIRYYVNRWIQKGAQLNGCYQYKNTAASGKGAQYFASNYDTLIAPYISDCYLFTIEHGENDASGARLGTPDNMNPDENGNYDITTFYGAMAYIITRSRSLNMYVKIGLIGSWYMPTREIVKNVANKFNLPVLDLYKSIGSSDEEVSTSLTLQDGTVITDTQTIRAWFSTYIGQSTGDNIHPYNPDVQDKLATAYANWINTF